MTVSGAGLAAANGKYVRTTQSYDGEPVFELDAKHQIYRNDGVWRLAQQGHGLYYVATVDTGADGPPVAAKGYWSTDTDGKDPPPSSIVCS